METKTVSFAEVAKHMIEKFDEIPVDVQIVCMWTAIAAMATDNARMQAYIDAMTKSLMGCADIISKYAATHQHQDEEIGKMLEKFCNHVQERGCDRGGNP